METKTDLNKVCGETVKIVTKKVRNPLEAIVEPAEIRHVINKTYFRSFTYTLHSSIESMLSSLGKSGYDFMTTFYRELPYSTLDSDTTPDEHNTDILVNEYTCISNEEWKSIREAAMEFPRTGLHSVEHKRPDCEDNEVLHILFYDEKEYIDELMDDIRDEFDVSSHLLTMFSDDIDYLSTKQLALIGAYLQMACNDLYFIDGLTKAPDHADEISFSECFAKITPDVINLLNFSVESAIRDITGYPFYARYEGKDLSDYSININTSLSGFVTLRAFCYSYEDTNAELDALGKTNEISDEEFMAILDRLSDEELSEFADFSEEDDDDDEEEESVPTDPANLVPSELTDYTDSEE